jgi:peptide/nickel transport system permease protein
VLASRSSAGLPASLQGVALERLARIQRRGVRERRWLRFSLGLGIAIVALTVVVSAIAPLLPLPSPNEQDYAAVLQPPSWAHPFGTDDVGRDLLSRTLAGGRIDLPVALIITVTSIALGVTLGALAGFAGGWVDTVIMRAADIALAFPFIVLVIAVIAIFGPGLKGVLIGVPLVGWAGYARLTRSEMLVVREQEYMLAARVLGLSRRRTLFYHALPNVWRPVLALSMIDVVGNMLLVAGLSYLGLGVQPPTAEWGGIIADGQQYLLTAWWISTLPGLVVVLVGVGFSLVGDAVADLLGRDLTLARA